jgi:hypothetical protein
VIAEEERIVEVDDAMAKGTRADAAAQSLAEGWVEVEKAPAEAVAAEGKTESAWVAVEEGVSATLAPELFLGTVLEERKEEGEVGKAPRDLTADLEAAGEGSGDEAAGPREILDLELEGGRTQEHGFAAEAALAEFLDAELQKQEVQAPEAVLVEERHLVAEAAPAQVIDDAGLEEEKEGPQAVQVIPREFAAETVPDAVLDAVLEKQQEEEQVVEVDQHELAAEVTPREFPDEVARELASEVAPREIHNEVARELAAELAPTEIPNEVPRESASEVAPRAIPEVVETKEEEPKEQSAEVVDQHKEVQNKEEAQCELGPVDKQEKPAPEKELAVPKADDLNVSQEDSSHEKAVDQLPEKEAALLEMPEDEDRANMEFEEWEGIERSEVEKRFGAAAAFAASDAGTAALSKLDSDVQLQLQGLLKVAIDGPCYDSTQPLTLRPSSRAKWYLFSLSFVLCLNLSFV